MRFQPQEISGEFETLEHRRARLVDLFTSGGISRELSREVSRMIEQVDQQLRDLRPCTYVPAPRIAA